MSVLNIAGYSVPRSRKGLIITTIILVIGAFAIFGTGTDGIRPDAAWLASASSRSLSSVGGLSLAQFMAEDVYTAQRNKLEAQRLVDKEAFGELEVVIWEEGVHDGQSTLSFAGKSRHMKIHTLYHVRGVATGGQNAPIRLAISSHRKLDN